MDKGQKGLRTLVSTTKNYPGLWGGGHIEKKNVVTQRPPGMFYKEKPIESFRGHGLDAPFFLGLKPFKDRVAIKAANGDFTYADLFNRSFYLSLEIKKVLRNASLPSQNQVISLICPNGASYVIGQWAVWMSGNIMVPLSGQHTPKALEYFIRDSQSSIVISANCFMDQVEDVAIKLDKPLICLDTNNPWQTHTVDFSEDSVYEGLIFNENVYPKDRPVMMLYLPDHKNKRMFFDHRDINEELDFVSKSWNLDENTTMLHSLSLYHTYGVVAALMSPLSVGGSVVMLPQFDTKKVWAHLLGLNVDGNYLTGTARVNTFAGVPKHYEALLKRYGELFKDPKFKKYVLNNCSKRMNTMVNGNSLLEYKHYSEWKKITGHEVKMY